MSLPVYDLFASSCVWRISLQSVVPIVRYLRPDPAKVAERQGRRSVDSSGRRESLFCLPSLPGYCALQQSTERRPCVSGHSRVAQIAVLEGVATVWAEEPKGCRRFHPETMFRDPLVRIALSFA